MHRGGLSACVYVCVRAPGPSPLSHSPTLVMLFPPSPHHIRQAVTHPPTHSLTHLPQLLQAALIARGIFSFSPSLSLSVFLSLFTHSPTRGYLLCDALVLFKVFVCVCVCVAEAVVSVCLQRGQQITVFFLLSFSPKSQLLLPLSLSATNCKV